MKFLCSIVVSVFITTALWAETDKEVKEKMKAKQEARFSQLLSEINIFNKSSRFDISGEIVDENGKPLEDVILDVDFSRPKGWESEDWKRKVKSGSSFSIEKSGYTGLNVEFQKVGYFSEKRFYSTRVGSEPKSKYLKDNVYSQHDEKIVLRAIGKLARLEKIGGQLKNLSKEKTQRVFDLSTLKFVIFPLDKTIPIKKFIQLDFERDQSGKIMMIQDQNKRLIPKIMTVKYVSDDVNDGFIIVGAPKDFSYLTTAPETGYTLKEIKVPYGSPDIYFFYSNGDNFGKGCVSSASASPEYGENRVFLDIMQNKETNPNEKRNLRSY